MSSRATVASVSGRAFASKASWPFERARDAGGEQPLLVLGGKGPQRGEGLRAVLDRPASRSGARSGPPAWPRRGSSRRSRRRWHPERCGRSGVSRDGDVERIVAVARGEHRASHLEQHEVEGGREVLGEMRLDQRRPDGAEIVGEPDADTGLLARLGLGIGTRAGGMAGSETEGTAILEPACVPVGMLILSRRCWRFRRRRPAPACPRA